MKNICCLIQTTHCLSHIFCKCKYLSMNSKYLKLPLVTRWGHILLARISRLSKSQENNLYDTLVFSSLFSLKCSIRSSTYLYICIYHLSDKKKDFSFLIWIFLNIFKNLKFYTYELKMRFFESSFLTFYYLDLILINKWIIVIIGEYKYENTDPSVNYLTRNNNYMLNSII